MTGSYGTFQFDLPLTPPVEVVGVWLASDGDDIGSAFTVVVECIVLEAAVMP